MTRYLRQSFLYSQLLRTLTLLGLIALTLAGCSNEDKPGTSTDNVTPPSAPILNLTPKAVKTFNFSWDDVDGVTEYQLLEDPTGNSGYTEVATIGADATDHELIVSLAKRINARYILRACNGASCSDSDAVYVSDTLVGAVGYFKASNTGENDEFGFAVALSANGSTLAVGALYEDSSTTGVASTPNDNATDAGAVYVFILNGNTWNEQAYIKASNTGAGDLFGYSVALYDEGNALLVGAPNEDSDTTGVGSTPNNNANNAGAAYLFVRSSGIWGQQAYIKASNTGEDDWFGSSVALSGDGNTLAVGAGQEDSDTNGVDSTPNDNAANTGAAYVFTRSASTWVEQAYIKASNPGTGDNFGHSLALSDDGNTLAVGALFENSGTTGVNSTPTDDTYSAGAAYVFSRSSGTWSEQAYVKASNTGAVDTFGKSVALSADGNTLAVGAINESSDTTGVGSTPNDNASGAGATYVFGRSEGIWAQQAFIKAFNTEANDRFGYSVTLSGDGNTLAVGARYEDSGTKGVGSTPNENASSAGAAYLFTRSGDIWSEQSYIKASNTEANEYFGETVSLSGDGNTLAVGASNENSITTGVNSTPNDNTTNAGAVYLY